MRITARQLRQIIREELNRSLYEAPGDETGMGVASMGTPPDGGVIPTDKIIEVTKDDIVEKVLRAVRDDFKIVAFNQETGRRTKMKDLQFQIDPAQAGDALYVATQLNQGGTYVLIEAFTNMVMFSRGLFKKAGDDFPMLGLNTASWFAGTAKDAAFIISAAAGGEGSVQPVRKTIANLDAKISALQQVRDKRETAERLARQQGARR